MHDLPADWSALCTVVFLLGMRHGFDADHLAAIDALTRLAACERRRHRRYCGALFSAGHGAVVLLTAAAVGVLSEHWEPPSWLSAVGTWVSVGFLLLLGIANLRVVLNANPGQVVSLVGIKGSWLAGLRLARTPLGVVAVGALFALSFDTIGQAAFFAATAVRWGGVAQALVLALLFFVGMVASDGLNGWWTSHLIARADEAAALASRVMSVAVSAVSLFVAALGAGRLLSPVFAGWSGGRELSFGAIVVLVIGSSYAVARALARHSAMRRRNG